MSKRIANKLNIIQNLKPSNTVIKGANKQPLKVEGQVTYCVRVHKYQNGYKDCRSYCKMTVGDPPH